MSFDSLYKDLSKQLEQINNNILIKNSEKVDNYDKNTHWKKMGLACEALSKECTKLALAFSKPPLPNENERKLLLRDVAQAMDILLAWYNTFPLVEGKTLCKKLQSCISNIIQSLLKFLLAYSPKQQEKKEFQLISTGTIWECCDAFKTLPSDNILAMMSELDSIYNVLSDTLQEIKDESETNENDDDMEAWDEDEKEILKPCVGLLMAAKGLIKNIRKTCKSQQPTKDADVISETFKELSPSVDELVSSLYHPMDIPGVNQHIESVSSILNKVVEFIRSCTMFNDEKDKSWIDFIQKAISHNVNKHKEKVSTLQT